ncbi:tyrosine-type recombinase/integrase [Microvirga massiliensis]|uniref:tyrosine-type recombinase/integrase n=1 Tax=Microvirga massiliensis TaxID=1033741 RepID=UPI00065F8657|nr:tyrosine-type recombinase/integrase [Microvirga massiliensis]
MNAPVPAKTYQNPFASPDVPTLADVADRIPTTSLSATRKRDCHSAIKRFSELVQKPASAIPADPASLGAELEAASPALATLSLKTRANMRSSLLTAVEASGLCRVLRTGRIPLLLAWEELLRTVPDKRIRNGLSRAVRFWSLNGITPAQVDLAALEAYSEALRASLYARKAPTLIRDTATLWNRIVEAQPDRNLTELVVKSRRAPSQRIDLATLPASFLADLEAHLTWASGRDLFAADARAKPLAASTLNLRRQQIQTIVTALVATGTPPEAITSLAALVTPDAVRAVLRHRHQWAGNVANASNEGLAKTLVSIAREWMKVDPATLAEIKRLQSKLPKIRAGLTEKNKVLLRHFDDPDALPRLYSLPAAILSRLNRSAASLTTLAQYQVALAIALLLYVPLRIANLAALELDATVFLPAQEDQESRLEIPAHRTKNRQPYSVMLPAAVTRMLRMYDRAFLQPLGTKLIFDNGRHAAKEERTLSWLIERTIRRHMGFKMTAHQFRHLAAKVILDEDPGAYPLVSQHLGHTNLKTAMAFYAELNTRRAARHHAKLLEAAIARAQASLPLCRKGRSMKQPPQGGRVSHNKPGRP